MTNYLQQARLEENVSTSNSKNITASDDWFAAAHERVSLSLDKSQSKIDSPLVFSTQEMVALAAASLAARECWAIYCVSVCLCNTSTYVTNAMAALALLQLF
jgi:hypothetical protein